MDWREVREEVLKLDPASQENKTVDKSANDL